MFPISSSLSSVYFLSLKFSCLISSSFSFIISVVFYPLTLSPFHHFQFLSSLPQYFLSYCLFDHLNNFFTVNHSGSSLLLNVRSFFSCYLISSRSCWYSFLYSWIASFAFFRFFLPFQVSDSTINLFYCTKYLFFSYICYLFRILFTFHSFSLSIITGAGCFFLYLSICSTYLCILLTLTTKCIFTVLGSSNSTTFNNTIFFIL